MKVTFWAHGPIAPLVLGLAALSAASGPETARAVLIVPPVTTISSGSYVTPETISLAPAGFGSLGGSYFIPDINKNALNGHVWFMPGGGGPPVSFATNTDYISVGGLFLPATGWGANSGNYLTTGAAPSGNTFNGTLFTYAPDGTRGTFATVPNGDFGQPQIAPAGFGAYGGQLIVPNILMNQVFAFTPGGAQSTVATLPIDPFGLAFAPGGFGPQGGNLFVSSTGGGNTIDVVTANGTVSPFASIPLGQGQTGLRQLAFAPAGFLPGAGPLLFVSVSGSAQGGGSLGNVYALDSSGAIVASLRSDLGLAKFDPRGLLFTTGGNLLVSDASDPILSFTPAAFQPVPEPTSVVLLGLGLAGLLLARKARAAV